jgi:endonuclease/exonuclease/phosphatase family metal-dependent hydrolase
VRFATYNIHHGAPPGRRTDHGRLRAAVRALGADVVALQEVDRHVVRSGFRDQARLAAAAAGREPLFAEARTLGPFGRYGNALLVPPGPLQWTVRPLSSAGEQRVALFSRLRVGSTAVTVVCTHLHNASGPGPGRAPAQLDELLAELGRWPRPWVLMGDLNLGEDEVVPRFARAGLTAAATGPTFPSRSPRVTIDWIGVRGLRIRSAEVPRLDASDHLPVVVDLEPPIPHSSGTGADREESSDGSTVDSLSE